MTSEIGLRVPSRTEAPAAMASQNGGSTPKQTAGLFGVVFVFPDPIAKTKVSTCSFHLMQLVPGGGRQRQRKENKTVQLRKPSGKKVCRRHAEALLYGQDPDRDYQRKKCRFVSPVPDGAVIVAIAVIRKVLFRIVVSRLSVFHQQTHGHHPNDETVAPLCIDNIQLAMIAATI